MTNLTNSVIALKLNVNSIYLTEKDCIYINFSVIKKNWFTTEKWPKKSSVAIGNPERQVRKPSYHGSKQQQRSCSQSLLLLLARATYIMVLFFTHIPFVVNHTINATTPERLQQHPFLFATNHTDRMFFVWRLNSARPSHPGYSTILLRSEIPSGKCAKLRTVEASNNRDHACNLSYYCLQALHI